MVEMGECVLGEDGEVARCTTRAKMLGQLCHVRPTDLRWWGVMDWRWEHWMKEEGMTRKHARAVMEVVHWVSKEYGARMWEARCQTEEKEGRGSKQRKIDRKERLKAEGVELAEDLGWGRDKVHYWFGGMQGWRQMQKRIKTMRAELKVRREKEERGGQRRIDEMIEGRRVKLAKGKRRGEMAEGLGGGQRREKDSVAWGG